MLLNCSYGDNYNYIFDLLKLQPDIEIDGKKYKELVNCIYEIPYEPAILEIMKEPHTEDDEKERNYLLKRIDDCATTLKDDINSRRAVYCNLYENNLAKCICLIQVFVRQNKLYINQYYRSQEFERNGRYDFQTATMLMRKASKLLNVEPGKVTVFVTSLHIGVE